MKTEELMKRMEYDREYRYECPKCGRHLSDTDIYAFWDFIAPTAKHHRLSHCCDVEVKRRI